MKKTERWEGDIKATSTGVLKRSKKKKCRASREGKKITQKITMAEGTKTYKKNTQKIDNNVAGTNIVISIWLCSHCGFYLNDDI